MQLESDVCQTQGYAATTTMSLGNFEEARMRLDFGEDLRHSNPFYEIFMIVGDRQQSLSATHLFCIGNV